MTMTGILLNTCVVQVIPQASVGSLCLNYYMGAGPRAYIHNVKMKFNLFRTGEQSSTHSQPTNTRTFAAGSGTSIPAV